MIKQLIIGSMVIAVTVAIQAEMFHIMSKRFEWALLFTRRYLHRLAHTGIIIAAVLYILLVQTIIVWIWSLVLLLVGAFQTPEPALYFTLVAYTSVGFGDLVLNPDWRILSGLTAANGVLAFGWSTAYMVELLRRTA